MTSSGQLSFLEPEALCGCMSHNGFLTRLGYAAHDAGWPLTGPTNCARFDTSGSVSAMAEAEDNHVFDDQLLDNQYERFEFHGDS